MDPFKKKFQRHIEDFICLVCKSAVQGTGYTNHCPQCLHSRHVDVNPGDRMAECRAIMMPIAKGLNKKGYYIVHHCQGCKIKKKNKVYLFEQQEVFNNLQWEEQ